MKRRKLKRRRLKSELKMGRRIGNVKFVGWIMTMMMIFSGSNAITANQHSMCTVALT